MAILGCCNSSGAGGGGTNPPAIGTNGAVDIESPANTITRRRARYSDLDPSFAISSFAVDLVSGAGGTPGLYERGETITVSGLVQAALSYVSGAPDSLSITNAYSGSANLLDVNLGAWASVAPFSVASCTGSVKRLGQDGGADPVLTVQASATQSGVNSTASAVYTWTSRRFWGLGSVGGGETVDEAFVEALSSELSQTANQTFTVSPSDQTVYQAIPTDLYNALSYGWTKGGFLVPVELKGTFSITNAYGVSRSYTVLGTVNRITQANATYTITG
jgi:hypothetical protein